MNQSKGLSLLYYRHLESKNLSAQELSSLKRIEKVERSLFTLLFVFFATHTSVKILYNSGHLLLLKYIISYNIWCYRAYCFFSISVFILPVMLIKRKMYNKILFNAGMLILIFYFRSEFTVLGLYISHGTEYFFLLHENV